MQSTQSTLLTDLKFRSPRELLLIVQSTQSPKPVNGVKLTVRAMYAKVVGSLKIRVQAE